MITITEAKKLGRSQTIDLKYIHNLDYVNSQDLKNVKTRLVDYFYIFLMTMWSVFIWFLAFLVLVPNTSAYDLQTQIRLDRLNTCEQAYKESWITEKHINYEMLVVRCATYNTLMFAYESNFWQSRMCLQDMNCHWIKLPSNRNLLKWINYTVIPWRFLKFESYSDNNLVFARSYFTYHYKKDTTTFIRWFRQADWSYAFGWSTTDTWTYINFIDSNYQRIYNELERLYIRR